MPDIRITVGALNTRLRRTGDTAWPLSDWRRRNLAFPEPVAKLKTAMVWAWPDVEKCSRATRHPRGTA
jgi:hypothetical protein